MPPRPCESLVDAVNRVRNLPPGHLWDQRMTHTYGVVVECSMPRPTRGTDLVVNLKLVDPSTEGTEGWQQGLDMLVFSGSAANMPQPANEGDIILVHRAGVQFYQNKAQLLGKLAQGKPFAYALFDGAVGGSDAPYASAGPLAEVSIDHAILQQLRALAQRRGIKPNVDWEGVKTYLRNLSQIEPPADPSQRPEVIDMRCQVLAIDSRDAQETVLYVWDGYDAQPFARGLQMQPAQWRGAELVAPPIRRIMPLTPQPGVELVEELPAMGTAVPVIMSSSHRPAANLPAVGSWIKLKVVGQQVVEGQLQLVCCNSTKLNASIPEQTFVERWQERQASNETAAWAPPPQQLVTRSTEQEVPLVTIRAMLQQQPNLTAGTFRLLVRVPIVRPGSIVELCRQPVTPPPPPAAKGRKRSRATPPPPWFWVCNLCLEDATGEVNAMLTSRHADQFFGMPPCDLAAHPEATATLQDIMARVTAAHPSGWLEVTVSSMYKKVTPSQPPAAGSAPAAAVAPTVAVGAVAAAPGAGDAGTSTAAANAAAVEAAGSPQLPARSSKRLHVQSKQQQQGAASGSSQQQQPVTAGGGASDGAAAAASRAARSASGAAAAASPSKRVLRSDGHVEPTSPPVASPQRRLRSGKVLPAAASDAEGGAGSLGGGRAESGARDDEDAGTSAQRLDPGTGGAASAGEQQPRPEGGAEVEQEATGGQPGDGAIVCLHAYLIHSTVLQQVEQQAAPPSTGAMEAQQVEQQAAPPCTGAMEAQQVEQQAAPPSTGAMEAQQVEQQAAPPPTGAMEAQQ